MKLALFFTRNISLEQWVKTGLFGREKLIYEEHLSNNNLQKVYWFTYGKNDQELAVQLKADGRLDSRITIIQMPRIFQSSTGCLIYSFIMPLIQGRILKNIDLFKTNQTDGSWAAVIASRLFQKPLIVRTGYTWSLLREKQKLQNCKTRIIKLIERFAFKHASLITVTSQSQLTYIRKKYSISDKKVKLIPNYIDINIFKPNDSLKKHPDRIVFVGRLDKEKNLFNLINAITQTELTLDVYGQGELSDKLKEEAAKRNAHVNFLGTLPNHELPRILNGYNFFILPSKYEAMPKSLIEAMACGLVCIGANTEGIEEIIDDRVNGYLAEGTDKDSLARTILNATSNVNKSITSAAVKKIQNSFSLQAVAQKEINAIKQIL